MQQNETQSSKNPQHSIVSQGMLPFTMFRESQGCGENLKQLGNKPFKFGKNN